jgi:hypothetical protein
MRVKGKSEEKRDPSGKETPSGRRLKVIPECIPPVIPECILPVIPDLIGNPEDPYN